MYFFLAIFSFLFSATSVVLCVLKPDLQPWMFPVPAFLGWITGLLLIKTRTAAVDIAANICGLISLGFSLDQAGASFPLFTVTLVVLMLTYSSRTLFIRNIGYVKQTWIEPVTLLTGIALFVFVNVVKHPGWYGWAFPAPIVLFGIVYYSSARIETKAFRRGAANELKVGIGSKAPDFALNDENGKSISLAEILKTQPVLLLFVRGDWCPTCHIMLRTYQRESDHFKRKNVMVLAIGPDPQGVNKAMVEKMSLSFHVLSDDRQEVLSLYGIQFLEPIMGQKFEVGSPLPASILIDRKGVIRHICRADRAGEFLNPLQIFTVLEKMDT
ncbi:MAG TPA: peroxiredoxin family protein [Bacteroidia bacterium]|nr:peroxiredoxin family protein [Bacteroidia bacterium]